jgi:hypothetical protein
MGDRQSRNLVAAWLTEARSSPPRFSTVAWSHPIAAEQRIGNVGTSERQREIETIWEEKMLKLGVALERTNMANLNFRNRNCLQDK